VPYARPSYLAAENARALSLLSQDFKDFLDEKHLLYNQPKFIQDDPICIPHLFSKRQDIEIMAFWASILAWGQRKTIITKCKLLVDLMDGAPYDFVLNHSEFDLKPFLGFKHRTFNDLDTLYFLSFFQQFYKKHDSLEEAFWQPSLANSENVEPMLLRFREVFFSLPDVPARTFKHVSSPASHSACKRINMFLRWMVRNDGRGVDFGLWKNIKPAQLVCPCDVHVDRVARRFGLITRAKTDWQTAVELTNNLKLLDPNDPVKYDFALFGIGIEEKAAFSNLKP
jgi:uncharacterized protein (TIGR02757 family)